MKQIVKSNRMADVRYDVRGPVVAEADRLIEQGIDVLKLNIGNPAEFGFTPPASLLDSFAEYARGAHGYSQSQGLADTRRAIVEYAKNKGLPNVGPKDVYTGNGVSEMITMCLQALLNEGDEVLIPSPDYPLWTAATVLNGGKAAHYLCDEASNWYPDIADLRRKVTGRTKAMVVISPNNPTGALYPKEILEQMAQVARENNLIIFSDEIYERLVMDGKEHVSIAALAPDLLTITMNGLSKSHSLCGFRAGWMCLCGDKSGAESFIQGLNTLSSLRLCSGVPSQYAIMTALNTPYDNETVRPGGRLYRQREYIIKAVNNIPGLSVVKPDAAFYSFPKIDIRRFGIKDDVKFVIDLLKQEHLLFVNGTGFNWHQPDHFRLIYLPEIPQLEVATQRLERFLSTYQQA